MRLSIIMPIFNEEDTLVEILSQVRAVALPGIEQEILVVDDGSIDRSAGLLDEQARAGDL